MENVRYVLHNDDLLDMTAMYGITSDEIRNIGGIDGDLTVAAACALVERDRGAVVEYWRIYWGEFERGTINYDIDGLFRWQFDITYED
ncbi:hypothetical protein [Exiguobacterium sp. s162]|uniref:hypothetical protein n=1 Tax=Exiguobacterium sp. s162 TaxID=2751276 RepID=UPI001BE9B308|nr:hypothetical protein [Exiguobacterium sp. s162]